MELFANREIFRIEIIFFPLWSNHLPCATPPRGRSESSAGSEPARAVDHDECSNSAAPTRRVPLVLYRVAATKGTAYPQLPFPTRSAVCLGRSSTFSGCKTAGSLKLHPSSGAVCEALWMLPPFTPKTFPKTVQSWPINVRLINWSLKGLLW